jgi:ADP-heptose:LPS heptosyltransferase
MVVLRALALGDFLTGLPALRALRKAFPQHLCFLTCPYWLRPLALATNAADEFIDSAHVPGSGESSGGHWVPKDLCDRIKLEQAQLLGLVGAPQEPDIAVNLRGERDATQRVLLALRPRRLIAYRNDNIAETSAGPLWRPDEHEVDRWCRLLSESGIPADPQDLHMSLPEIAVPDFVRGATLIHPGAGSPARLWPPERWAAVARWEAQRGKSVVITGGSHEVELALEVAERSGLERERVLAGRTGVLELAAIVSAAARVVCPITGVAHLAWAVHTPSVTLFATVPPSRWGPPPYLPQHRVLWAGMIGEPYAPEPDPGLLKISVEDVIREIRALD